MKLLAIPFVLAFLGVHCDSPAGPTVVVSQTVTIGASPNPSPAPTGACTVDRLSISGRSFVPLGSSSRYTLDMAQTPGGQAIPLSASCIAGKTYTWSTSPAGTCRPVPATGGDPNQIDVTGDAVGQCGVDVLLVPDQKTSTTTVPVQ